MDLIEIIGYVASVLIAVSLTMTNVVRLRIINLIGCLLFSFYGFVIDALPVALMNAFCAGINAYNLIKLARQPADAQA